MLWPRYKHVPVMAMANQKVKTIMHDSPAKENLRHQVQRLGEIDTKEEIEVWIIFFDRVDERPHALW